MPPTSPSFHHQTITLLSPFLPSVNNAVQTLFKFGWIKLFSEEWHDARDISSISMVGEPHDESKLSLPPVELFTATVDGLRLPTGVEFLPLFRLRFLPPPISTERPRLVE